MSDSDSIIEQIDSEPSLLAPNGLPVDHNHNQNVLEMEDDEEDQVFSSSDDDSVVHDQGHESGASDAQATNRPKENKFLFALMNAAQSFSSRLRVPSAPSASLSTSAIKSTRLTGILPSLKDVIDSDDDSVFSSEDMYSDDELLCDRPKLNADQAARLLYHPSGPWATFSNAPIEDPVVLAKLHAGSTCEASIKQGTIRGRKVTYISKTWRMCQTWDGVFSEIALYSHPSYLRPLQGSVVPTIIGVYLVEGAISVAMELPSSLFWIEASEDMSNHLKRKCIAAYDAIHGRGVLHNDVELRHILVSAEGNVSIIDFQDSRALNPVKEINLGLTTEADIRLERRKVLYKLNYDGAQARECEKRRRVLRKRERDLQRQRRRKEFAIRISRGESLAPPQDNESEPEDPDDVLDPIVSGQTWGQEWLGDEIVPECYIVPGQDEAKVGAMMQEFISEELDRQDKDKTMSIEDGQISAQEDTSHSVVEQSSLSPPTRNLEQLDQAFDNKGGLVTMPAHASLVPTMNSELPPRPILKRGREHSEDNDYTSDDAPSRKRRLITSAFEDAHSSDDVKTLVVSEDSRLPTISSASSSDTAVERSAFTVPPALPSAAKTIIPKIPAVIQVPYEGYTGPDGFSIPNTFTPMQVANMRRVWITQDNVQRCQEAGLSYPYAQRYDLTPSTVTGMYVMGRHGKMKKKKLTTNRGALKRWQMEMKAPGKAKKDAAQRREEYLRMKKLGTEGLGSGSKSATDDVAEGPKILTLTEYKKYEKSCRVTTSPPAGSSSSPSPATATRPRSILRRQLGPEEKFKQRHYEQWLKENGLKVTDDEDETTDTQEQEQKPANPAQIGGSSSSAPVAPLSSDGPGTVRDAGLMDPFTARSPAFGRAASASVSTSSRSILSVSNVIIPPRLGMISLEDIYRSSGESNSSSEDSDQGQDREEMVAVERMIKVDQRQTCNRSNIL